MNDKRYGEPLYDFPCSYTFRAYEALIHEGIELPPIEPSEEAPLPEPIIKTIGLSYQQREEFNQMKAHILFLEGKINEHLDKKRKTNKYTKYIS